ncbi:hypothetical protein GCM10009868_32420 [Terrabacter aerolatus]|uniref:Uncharacterized protein n=1 Tax=Terrabacter aerolatus TaxID=422442 RepID=A0A512CYQ1_9MICO|nr:hypothetical protein [Terrabacter aerolatus]GEO29314.1 hypothetical protein TAE01_11240 [Terrabacter aerolatus]
MTPTDGPAAPSDRAEPTPAAPPPGSVAEEAALLVDLLSRRSWAGSSGMPSPASHGDGSDGAPHGHDSAAGQGPHAGHGGDSGGRTRSSGRPDASPGECTCGGTTPAACRVCPVCQLIAFVQQVNPDTIDRVADFIGFAATALRDLATTQRERRAEPRPEPAEAPAGAADEPADEPARQAAPPTASASDRARPGDSA